MSTKRNKIFTDNFRNMIRTYLLTLALVFLTTLGVKSQFLTRTTQTDLNAFTSVNGQWIAIGPSNNTLGANFYQGLNFGFDANNYMSLVNPIGTNDIYFGRWEYAWQGWNGSSRRIFSSF